MPKKKYEPPEITGPDSGGNPEDNSSPAGVTGCAYGAFGGSCSDGANPQGSLSQCSIGGDPSVPNCSTGTTAGAACTDGTDAVFTCSTGTSVPGDCADGITPLGATCSTGTAASSCTAGN